MASMDMMQKTECPQRNFNICDRLYIECYRAINGIDFWTKHGFQEIYTSGISNSENTKIFSKEMAGYIKSSLDELVSSAASDNLASDFSAIANPNGAWSYGWMPNGGGQFSAFNKPEQYTDVPPLFYDAANANLRFWTAGTAYSLFVAANIGNTPLVFRDVRWQGNSVWQHPGQNGEMAVSRWIASKNGTFKVNSTFSLLENGSIDVRILKNGLPLFSENLSSSKMTTSNSTMGNVDVVVGDKLDFVVGYGGDNWLADETMISVSITPATANDIVF